MRKTLNPSFSRHQHNIVLISANYGSSTPHYFSIIYKNKEQHFTGPASLKTFIGFLKNEAQKKKKKTIFFTDNATFLFLTFLNFEITLQQKKPIEFLAIKNKIYYFNLCFENHKFHFRDINLYFPG
jgi:hypothetical protein